MTESQESPSMGRAEGGAGPPHVTAPGAEGPCAEGEEEPAHHARRPMNAFLIFCKRHRSVVRDKYPNLENRSITKILGEWWAILEKEEKACYTGLAKQYKDAFFTANPGFKWYKLPAPPLRTFTPRPPHPCGGGSVADHDSYSTAEYMEVKGEQTNNNHLTKLNFNSQPSTSSLRDIKDGKKQVFTPGKLADEAQMGGISNLIISNKNQSDEDCYNDRSYQPYSPPIGMPLSLFETPKNKITNFINAPETPMKKNTSMEINERLDRTNLYSNDQVSPPERILLSPEENKLQKLQDALSETSRLLELSFDNSNESAAYHDKSNSNSSETIKNVMQNDKYKDSYNLENMEYPLLNKNNHENSDEGVNRKFTLKYQSSVSSDESQDKDSNLLDDLAMYKNKTSWNNDYDQAQARGSGRACKGKRYQEFMAYGGLLVNKRQKKEHMDGKPSPKHEIRNKISYDVNSPACSWKIYENYPKEGFNRIPDTIDKDNDESEVAYCDRMDISESAYKSKTEANDTGQTSYYLDDMTSEHSAETVDSLGSKMFKASDFDLDAKIRALPSLSLEKFQQKKKENKKRKKNLSSSKHKETRARLPINSNIQYFPKENAAKPYLSHGIADQGMLAKSGEPYQITYDERRYLAEQRKTAIIGSKKRKPRKISITRIDVNSCTSLQCINNDNQDVAKISCTNVVEPEMMPTSTEPLMTDQNSQHNEDLCALTTLAEVAAITSKINEDA